MDKEYLTEDHIKAYKTILCNPEEYRLNFRPMKDCFEKSETVTANHTLAEVFLEYVNRPLPKLIIYILMDDLFGPCNGKDHDGNLGYYLKFIKE